MAEELQATSRKARKRQKASLVEKRGVLRRVILYAWPYRTEIAIALFFAAASAFLAAFSILPFVPIIDHVLDPDKTVERRAESEKRAIADEEIVQQIEELEAQIEALKEESNLEDGTPPESGGVQETAEGALEDLTNNYPFIAKTRARISALKDRGREKLDEFLIDKQEDAIIWIVVFLIVIVIIRVSLDYRARYSLSKSVYRSVQRLKVDLYTSCVDMDMTRLSQHTSGNLIARLSSDVSRVRLILQALLTQSVRTPFELFFLFTVMLILNAKVTMVTIIGLPLVILPIVMLSRTLRKLSKRDAEEDAYLVDVMQETLQGMQIVKAFGSERREQKRFNKVSREQLKRQIRRMRLSLAAPAITEVLTMAAMGAVMIAGTYVVLKQEEMSAGEFIVYLGVMTRFYKPLKSIANSYTRIQKGLASAERVFEIIDARPTIVEKPNAKKLPEISRDIIFEDVYFRYPNKEEDVLKGFDLEVPKGKCYALVGLSGAGKTTVTKLIPRFYDPTAGSIKIDGHDLRDVTFQSLRDQIAIVTQETVLFDTTIAANIAYGRQNANPDEIEEAARAANAHDFIMQLPEGYDTSIGERGGQLSGGQRQRLATARALLRDAPILILDEATSALDNESEALVQQALEKLMKNRTTIVIAHRLSTVRNADQIVVMEDGRAIEQGTHDDLLEAGGRYAEFCRREFDRATEETEEMARKD